MPGQSLDGGKCALDRPTTYTANSSSTSERVKAKELPFLVSIAGISCQVDSGIKNTLVITNSCICFEHYSGLALSANSMSTPTNSLNLSLIQTVLVKVGPVGIFSPKNHGSDVGSSLLRDIGNDHIFRRMHPRIHRIHMMRVQGPA